MAKLLNSSSFISYELGEVEEEVGQILNYEQTLVLQNDLAVYAEEKVLIRLPAKQEDYLAFAMATASLDAKIEYIKYLLFRSDEAYKAASIRAANNPQ